MKEPKTEKRTLIKRFKEAVSAFLLEPTVLSGPILVPTSTAVINDNRGNQFINYSRAVKEITKRHRNEAQYGNSILRQIVNYRVGWIAGNGANITVEGRNENKFLERFMKLNSLDGQFLTRIVRGSELEGKALIFLTPVKDEEGEVNIKLKYINWTKFGYTILTDDIDEEEIKGAVFTDSKNNKIKLSPEEFVYVSMDRDGRNVNEPTPLIATILTNIINMDKAMADWRAMNHYWGSLGLFFSSKDVTSAQMMIDMLDSKGSWQYGDVIAGPAEAKFPEPSGNGQSSLEKEIDMQARICSGGSGVPIHLMGWVSMMSNRATAEEANESINSLTSESRDIWQQSIEKITAKAFEMFNRASGANLKTDTIQAKLTQVTQRQLKELIDIWLPLADSDVIPLIEVQRRVPGTDIETLREELEEQKETNMERQKDMIGIMKSQSSEEDEEENETEDQDETDAKNIRAV